MSKPLQSEYNDYISPQFEDAVVGDNSYGLDISNPDYILFTHENIMIEIVGGIQDVMLSSLRVSLKIYKTGAVSPLEIYRSSLVDVFNDNQVEYIIGKVCERLRIESARFTPILYDCIERLDHYRRNKDRFEIARSKVHVPSPFEKEALSVLKSSNLLEEIKSLLGSAGVCDTRLGLQLFIIALSRITERPLHAVVNGSRLVVHQLISQFQKVLPEEALHELTTISKHAISYPPTPDFWHNKTLVLHQLDCIKQKDNGLLEYILQGKSKRLVTQSDPKTGGYASRQKEVCSSIQLISYMSGDYHPVLQSKQTLCIPLTNTNQVQEQLYEQEVKELAGLLDTQQMETAAGLLAQIQRELKAFSVYNPIIEQIDIAPFFGNDIKAMSQYLNLVNCITLLHQKQLLPKLTKTTQNIEVKASYMISALELFKELWLKKDDELSFNVRGTFNRIKDYLRTVCPQDYLTQTFQLKKIRKELAMAPATLHRHLHNLELYGYIERCGGNNRTGYDYKILEWTSSYEKRSHYDALLVSLKALISS